VWRSHAQLELATVEWVAWFNHDRLHGSLGEIPPVEFETLHHPEPAGLSIVSAIASIAAGGLETSHAETLGVAFAANHPISPEIAPAARSAPAQAAPTPVERRTAAAGLSDLRVRDILTDNHDKIEHQRPT
jgi:Integrase core domain